LEGEGKKKSEKGGANPCKTGGVHINISAYEEAASVTYEKEGVFRLPAENGVQEGIHWLIP